MEPSGRVRKRWRRAGLYRQRLPRLRVGDARLRCTPRRASALSTGGDANDERPLDSRAKGGLRVLAGVLRSHGMGYFDHMGWGFGLGVRTGRTHLGTSVGSYGWSGYYGTAWYNDPAEDLIAIVFLQRAHAGDQRLPIWLDFWTSVYQAIDD